MSGEQKRPQETELIRPMPFPIVLSAPSGAGKTTIVHEIFERFPAIRFSVSLTTRERREGEVEGRDYRFLTEAEFSQARDSGELAEWAVVHGDLYGTPRDDIDRSLEGGHLVLLDVDVQGGESLMDAYPHAVSIFLLPPSLEVLEERLRGRGTETTEAIDRRLTNALEEIEYAEQYEYVIVNREIDETAEVVAQIIRAEEHRRSRKKSLGQWLELHFRGRRSVEARPSAE
jgi:guanylate kinase